MEGSFLFYGVQKTSDDVITSLKKGDKVRCVDTLLANRETDSLGTEATRAGIIELLFCRQFLVRQGRQIRATSRGKQLIANLPMIAIIARFNDAMGTTVRCYFEKTR